MWGPVWLVVLAAALLQGVSGAAPAIRSVPDGHCHELITAILARPGIKDAPTSDANNKVEVSVQGNYYGVQNIIEREGRIILLGGITLMWVDPRLAWLPTECHWIQTIHYPLTDIWFPLIWNVNAFESPVDPVLWEKNNVFIYMSGMVVWHFGKKYDLACEFKMAEFPVDLQECVLDVFIMGNINVTVQGTGFNTDMVLFSHEIWKFKSTRLVLGRDSDMYGYQRIQFYLTIERQVTYYFFSLILPTLVLTPLPMITFILPPDSGEKLSVALTTLLTYFVMSLSFFEGIPTTDKLPRIANVFLYEMVMSVLGALLAAILVRIAESEAAVKRDEVVEISPYGEPSKSPSKFKQVFCSEVINRICLVIYGLATFLGPTFLVVGVLL